MNYDLAYSCDVHSDGTVHYNIDRICMFDIKLTQLDSFIMGTNENSKNIHVSHDVTPKKRKNLREKKKKKIKKNECSISLILWRDASWMHVWYKFNSILFIH